jgi:hypothetical protein
MIGVTAADAPGSKWKNSRPASADRAYLRRLRRGAVISVAIASTPF